MMKKLCVTTGALAAAAALTLLATPAHADTNAGNSSNNHDTSPSGNNCGDVNIRNWSGTDATSVNNVNGNAVTATDGSDADSSVDS